MNCICSMSVGQTIGGPIEENVALLKRLKAAGRPVYALNNFASVKFALAR